MVDDGVDNEGVDDEGDDEGLVGIFLTQSCPEGRNVFDWFNLTTNRKTGENCGVGQFSLF